MDRIFTLDSKKISTIEEKCALQAQEAVLIAYAFHLRKSLDYLPAPLLTFEQRRAFLLN
jgi:hypothetical protein